MHPIPQLVPMRTLCGKRSRRYRGHVWSGVLSLTVTIGVAAAVIGLVLYARELLGLARRALLRTGLVTAPPPTPPGPPVERLARDVERIHRDLIRLPAGTPLARRRGILAAYDDALADACRAMQVPQRLEELPAGVEREIERLRVEEALAATGIIPARTPGR